MGLHDHAQAASIATIDVYENDPVIDHLYHQGRRLAQCICQATAFHGPSKYVNAIGRESNLGCFTREPDRKPPQAFRPLVPQELIKKDVLAPFVVSHSYSDAYIDRTIDAVDKAFVYTEGH